MTCGGLEVDDVELRKLLSMTEDVKQEESLMIEEDEGEEEAIVGGKVFKSHSLLWKSCCSRGSRGFMGQGKKGKKWKVRE